jgi:hypothetical protein
VRSEAAEAAGALGDGDAFAEPRCGERCALARRAGADDDEVVGRVVAKRQRDLILAPRTAPSHR